MRTKLLITIILAIIGLNMHGQNKYEVVGRNFDGTPTFIKFQEDANYTVNTFFDLLKEEFKFTSDDKMKLLKTTSDQLSFKHYKYNQVYKNIIVYGAEYILHEKEGKLKTANGKFFSGLSFNVNPTISEKQALENAMKYLGENKYRWQNTN